MKAVRGKLDALRYTVIIKVLLNSLHVGLYLRFRDDEITGLYHNTGSVKILIACGDIYNFYKYYSD